MVGYSILSKQPRNRANHTFSQNPRSSDREEPFFLIESHSSNAFQPASRSLFANANVSRALREMHSTKMSALSIKRFSNDEMQSYVLASSRLSMGEMNGLRPESRAATVRIGSRHRKIAAKRSILLIRKSAGMVACKDTI